MSMISNMLAKEFNPFEGNTIEKVIPVTESQQEVWLSCAIGGKEADLSYIESLTLILSGELNQQLLEQSLNILIQRHESLRSSFSPDGTKMIIYENIMPSINYFDLSLKSKQEQNDFINDYHKNDAITAFDLTMAPLIRFGLFKKTDYNYLLNISTHHIVCDGWSFGILLEDLSAIYNALHDGLAMPAMPIQFSQYAISEREFVATPEYTEMESYWINKYKNDVPAVEIPLDFPRTRTRSYASRRDDYTISNQFGEQIKKAGAKCGSSLVNTLMSAFEVMIFRETGQPDIVLGVPTAGQAATEQFNLIGHCVNLLPIRSKPESHIKFSEYLKKRKSQTLEDYSYQRFTIGTLLKRINIPRNATWVPLCPLSFNIDIGMDMNVQFKGLQHKIIYNPRVTENFEIFLNITDAKDGYIFQWAYNTNLYRPETIESLMDKYKFVLQQIVNNIDVLIDDILLEQDDRRFKEIVKLNDTYKELPDNTVIELFENTVKKHPDLLAVKYLEKEFTYSTLNKIVNRFSHYLISQGVKKGDSIALLLDRSPDIVISLLAVLKCEATYVPIDPEFPEERVQFMLKDSETSYIILNSKYSEKFNTASKKIIINDIYPDLQNYEDENPASILHNDDVAYILYTSGSTGHPKGVMITNKNLLNLILAIKEMLHTNEHTRLLSLTTISFDIAELEIFLPLVSGGLLVLADYETIKSGEAIVHNIIENKINLIQATPATYKMMLNSGWQKKLPMTILCGGETMQKSLVEMLLPRCNALYNLYGPTETTIWSTATQVFETDQIITIGKPIANTHIYILDKNLKLLPENSVGEIYIGGEGVGKGYKNQPELTDQKFIQNPFIKNGYRLYATGDLGKYTSCGNIICLGRMDNQAKLRGYRIELEEIEYYLSLMPNVKDVVALIKTDAAGEQTLAACIVPHNADTADFSKEEIIHWRQSLSKYLPQYMIPNEWIKLQELPLTPNKKIDRKLLQEIQNSKVYQKEIYSTALNAADIIKLLTTVWQEELGINDIDVNDDFFELGGHSLIAVKVMKRVEKELEISLPISVLFERSTIKSLSEILSTNTKINNKVVIPIKCSGSKLPIFLVHAGGLNILLYKSLSEFLNEDQPLYGLQGLGLDGDLTHLGSIEQIAARYLSEVLEHEPDGPYIIMGYSFGGIIAYEMVKQLLDIGKQVKILGILDTNIHKESSDKLTRLQKKFLRQFKKIKFFISMFFHYPEETIAYQWLYINRKFNKNFVDPEEDQIHDFSPKIIKAYNDAYNSYKMTPLDIEIHLFKVKKRIYFIDDTLYLGWKKYALKGIQIHTIPGDHKTFMLAPNNRILVEKLQEIASKNK